MAFREKAYTKRAWGRLRIAIDVLSAARVTVSDRLHAHIIASLLGKPHVALDNTYGKIRQYIGAWGNDGLALRAESPEAIRNAVDHLLSGTPVPEENGQAWNWHGDGDKG